MPGPGLFTQRPARSLRPAHRGQGQESAISIVRSVAPFRFVWWPPICAVGNLPATRRMAVVPDHGKETPVYDPVSALLGLLFPRQYVKCRDGVLDKLWDFVIPILVVVLLGVAVAVAAGWVW